MKKGSRFEDSENSGDILHFENNLDVLVYYSKVAKVLKRFLRGKKIASKVYLPDLPLLKRGSKLPALYIEDFSVVSDKMLELRKAHLDEVKQKLNEKQELVWRYFPPRKLIEFFYATNDEGVGKPIKKIFIDIDRKNFSSDKAREVVLALIQEVKNDMKFNKMLKFRIFAMWTGSSFHIYLLLKKQINLAFYNRYLSYGKGKEDSFLMKWAENIRKKLGIKVEAGHEKTKNKIILDSSNTPSGKLARCPFSLHVKSFKEFDGVAVPVSEEQLKEKNLISRLQKLTPRKVINNLGSYGMLL